MKQRRWYWYLGLTLLILLSGFPVAAFKSMSYLVSGMPKSALAELLFVPLNWAEWLLVTIPTRLEEAPVIGILTLLGTLVVPTACIYLMYKGRKK